MENEVIEFVGTDITDVAPQNENGLLEFNQENVLRLAKRADEYVTAINTIMKAAVKITNELDWVCIGGKYYLKETGTAKVASLLGVSTTLLGKPVVEVDVDGYKTFTYTARVSLEGRYVDVQGSRSMKDDFYAKQGKDKPLKKPDEISERHVKMAAYTNCEANGVKRLVPGLRNVDPQVLKDADFDLEKIEGYTFKTGSKGGNSGKAEDSGIVCEVCGKAITQKVASYSQSKFGRVLCMDCQKAAQQPTA